MGLTGTLFATFQTLRENDSRQPAEPAEWNYTLDLSKQFKSWQDSDQRSNRTTTEFKPYPHFSNEPSLMSTDKDHKKSGLPKAIKKELLNDIKSAGGVHQFDLEELLDEKADIYDSFKRKIENFVNYLRGLDSIEYKQAQERIVLGYVKTRKPTAVVLPTSTSSKPLTSASSNKPLTSKPSRKQFVDMSSKFPSVVLVLSCGCVFHTSHMHSCSHRQHWINDG